MADESTSVPRFSWSEALPFVRLFRAGRQARSIWPTMFLGLAAVTSLYLVGRLLDVIWVAAGSGVTVDAIPVFANTNSPVWRHVAQDADAAGDTRMRGPFISLFDYESDCLAAIVQSVCHGRIGFGGSAHSGAPALLSSLGSASDGIVWLATQRPWYGLLFYAAALATLAFFGGAICRIAAIETARDTTVRLGTAIKFACEKFFALVGGPLALPLIFAGAWAFMFLFSAIGSIPSFGILKFLSALLYGLFLIGGVALVFAAVGTVFGGPLMWPTIAVEGSDAFDSVSRGCGYVIQRPWGYALYSIVLLIYGALTIFVVRALAMTLLKLTHAATGAGMSFFGVASSHKTEDVAPLDAMWSMPAWQDLPWLPAVGGVPFWGTFGNAPLSSSETASMYLIAFWVFLVVGLVGGYVLSLFFCSATQMYYLLRHDVDGVDYDEIFYEGEEDELDFLNKPPADAPSPEAKGTPLPVVSSPPGNA